MKKYLLKPAIAFFLTMGLTILLYWPIYQKIPLGNLQSNLDKEVNKLDLPLGDDIKEILDRSVQLPTDRHELCLKNRNGFHFIHSDSNSPGIPFLFYTNDLNQYDFGRKNKLGAMGVTFYYEDNSSEPLLYREFGWPRECIKLETEKLKNYASSTVEYSYVGLNQLGELDLGEQGKLKIFRTIAGGYSIDTSRSSVYIIARWKFFIFTFVTLFGILLTAIKLLTKYWPKLSKIFKKSL